MDVPEGYPEPLLDHIAPVHAAAPESCVVADCVARWHGEDGWAYAAEPLAPGAWMVYRPEDGDADETDYAALTWAEVLGAMANGWERPTD